MHYTVSKLSDQCERSVKGQTEVVYTDIRSETPVCEFCYLHVSIMYRLRGKNFKCLDKNCRHIITIIFIRLYLPFYCKIFLVLNITCLIT